MGAEVPFWVEIEVTMKLWRESYGVVPSEAIRDVHLNEGEKTTGNYRGGMPQTEEDEHD